jgi:cysteine synthase A
MGHYLLQHDGLFLGGSASLNVAGAYLMAKQMGPGHTIVTILCDGGARYASKMYNKEWLASKNLSVTSVNDLSFIREAEKMNGIN